MEHTFFSKKFLLVFVLLLLLFSGSAVFAIKASDSDLPEPDKPASSGGYSNPPGDWDTYWVKPDGEVMKWDLETGDTYRSGGFADTEKGILFRDPVTGQLKVLAPGATSPTTLSPEAAAALWGEYYMAVVDQGFMASAIWQEGNTIYTYTKDGGKVAIQATNGYWEENGVFYMIDPVTGQARIANPEEYLKATGTSGYWIENGVLYSYDPSTGKTEIKTTPSSSGSSNSYWEDQGKFYQVDTSTGQIMEVSPLTYYKATNQEGFWRFQTGIYYYSPSLGNSFCVSSSGSAMGAESPVLVGSDGQTIWAGSDGQTVYRYNSLLKSIEVLSEDGYYWDGQQAYKIVNNTLKEISAEQYVKETIIGNTHVSQTIVNTVVMELQADPVQGSSEIKFSFRGLPLGKLTVSEQKLYYGGVCVGEVVSSAEGIITAQLNVLVIMGSDFGSMDSEFNAWASTVGEEALLQTKGGLAITSAGNESDLPQTNDQTVGKGINVAAATIFKSGSPSAGQTDTDHENQLGTHGADIECTGASCPDSPASGKADSPMAACSTAFSCSSYYARNECGDSLDDGCGGTMHCTSCTSGFSCSNGSCSCTPKTVCSIKSACGIEDNGCGGRLSCGSCPAGMQCDITFRECIPESEKTSLELGEIKVFPYSSYAVFSWNTTIPADSVLALGKTEALESQQSVSKGTKSHSVFVQGLEPDTTYYYKVSVSSGNESKESTGSFRTLKPGEGDEELKVLWVSVDPPGKTEYEGYSFSFTALTNSLEPENLEFDWDFGDGMVAQNAGYTFYHSYYGLSEKEKKFTVKVTARDKKGNKASGEVEITVLKAVFKPVMLSPKQFERISKKGDLNFAVFFLDEQNNIIECGKIGFKGIFAGRAVEMKCNDGNIFMGSVPLWHGLDEMELFAIYATYSADGKEYSMKTRAPVYLKPLQIRIAGLFMNKKYFLNDSLENAKIRFLLDEIFLVFPQDLKAELVSKDKTEQVKIERGEYDYVVSFEHKVEESDLAGGLSLRIEGRDSHGNVVAEFSEVPIETNNPELYIELLEPKKEEMGFAFGQKFLLRAKVIQKSASLESKQLFAECESIGFFQEMNYDLLGKEYRTEIVLPESGAGDLLCRLHAYGLIGEKQVESIEFFTVLLSGDLNIEFVSPSQGVSRIAGTELREISVKLLQQNARVFEGKDLNALVSFDGNESYEVQLKFDNARKLHYAVLPAPVGLGRHSVRLVLSGQFHGSGEITALLEEDLFGLSLLGSIIGAVLAVLALWLIFSFARNSMAEKKLLLEEKQKLLGLKKKYKYEYFKRHISEEEFNRRAKEIEKGLESVSLMLKRGFWMHVGLMRAIYRSKDMKKLPERVQASALSIKLAGKRGEFSRIEMAKAMRAEKYSETVIELVLARLFG
ncbi:MAG: hypothetical protein NT067_05330 [Candidatus Diapherotrites archaeon]|nr:hypothetical protein [Candidatus Diapherotrites archaeon]